jgi:hypothetical protein
MNNNNLQYLKTVLFRPEYSWTDSSQSLSQFSACSLPTLGNNPDGAYGSDSGDYDGSCLLGN